MIHVHRGDGPVLLAQPHTGTHVPAEIGKRLNDTGLALADTDWYIDRLYDGLLEDATIVHTRVHRYVIDVNRDPGGANLYPGMNTTALCPLTDFDGRAIYRPGQEPGDDEIESRRQAYHAPYHDALSRELARIRQHHDVAVLYDCHSIRSRIAYLFEGTLPVFNIGTNDGRSCAAPVEQTAADVCAASPDFDTVVNGRFKGGWTTRHYGAPAEGVHAIQMELAQRVYMQEAPPWHYDPARADSPRRVLRSLLLQLRELALSGALS